SRRGANCRSRTVRTGIRLPATCAAFQARSQMSLMHRENRHPAPRHPRLWDAGNRAAQGSGSRGGRKTGRMCAVKVPEEGSGILEVRLGEVDDDPSQPLELALPADVPAPLLLVGPMTVPVVLDGDLQLGIRQIDTADQPRAVENLPLHDGFRESVGYDQQSRLGLLGRLHTFSCEPERGAHRDAAFEAAPALESIL